MLAALQHSWLTALYRGRDVPVDGLRGHHDVERFDIYRASLQANLNQALADTYPVVAQLVGPRFFEGAAQLYCRQHPSRHGDIHVFGSEFADFLAHFEPARSLPYLVDVARLEWLAHRAFHAADCDALGIDRLAGLSPVQLDQVRLGLHPSMYLMQSAFPVHRIWQANQTADSADEIDLDEGAVNLAIYRDGLEIALLPLEGADYAFVTALQGHDLATACEATLASHSEFAPGPALHLLFSQGLITELSIGESSCRPSPN